MGQQSHYEINVSLNGHLFATAERSAITMHDCRILHTLFLQKFPESEGYKIGVTHWNCSGTIIDMSKPLGGQ